MTALAEERVDWVEALGGIDWADHEAGPEPEPNDWIDEGWRNYTSPAHFAGAVAFEVVKHSTYYGEGLRALYGSDSPVPDEFRDWMFELLNDVGRIGYLVGKIDVPAFDAHSDHRVTDKRVARAVAALLEMDLDESKGGKDR